MSKRPRTGRAGPGGRRGALVLATVAALAVPTLVVALGAPEVAWATGDRPAFLATAADTRAQLTRLAHATR